MRWLLAAVFVANLAASDLLVAGALVAAGDQHLAQGRIQDAIQAFTAATEVAPDSGFAWYRLGRAYQANGQSSEKLAAFRRARQADPKSQEIAKALAFVLLLNGNKSEAMEHYDVSAMAMAINVDCWGKGGSCGAGDLGFIFPTREPKL